MTNDELFDMLESSHMVSEAAIEEMRGEVERFPGRFDSYALIRRLITRGQITQAQGDRLLEVARRNKPPKRSPLADDDLEVLPDEEEAPPAADGPPPTGLSETRTAGASDDMGLRPLLDEPPARKKRPPEPAPRAAGPPAPAPKKRRSWRSEVPRSESMGLGLDDLLGPALAGDLAEGDPLKAASRSWFRRAASPRAPGHTWDSPLLLLGGGALLLLVIAGGVLMWATNRQTGDQALALAEEDYRAGSYAQAVFKFDQYLDKFPTHAAASRARVHRGLAQLRQAVDTSTDWNKALATAEQVVQRISSENDFAEAHGELAALLPAISKGLAEKLTAQPDRETLDAARRSLALVDKYVPASLRPSDAVRDYDASLALAERRLDRDRLLAAAVEAMNQAVAAGTPQLAYARRNELIKTYPDLAESEALAEAVRRAAQAERAGVKFTAEARPALTDEAPSPILASVPLVSRTAGEAPASEVETVYALAAGAAYALDARTGAPLWRRFVGFETQALPQEVSTKAGRATLLLNVAQREVALVDSRTGRLRWRQTVADAVEALPLVVRDRMLVATLSGKLHVLSVETGAAQGYVAIPQPLRVPPAIDARERLYYQVADQSNLFVIAADGGECREVFYLGHGPETVRVAPLVVGRYLYVVENRGLEDSTLHVLLTNDQGLELKSLMQIALRGHVYAPLATTGRTLLAATDRGAMQSFEIGSPEAGAALVRVAEKPPDDKPPLVRMPLLRGSDMWIAGQGLTKYDVRASRGLLSPKWSDDDRSLLVHPAQAAGSAVIYARQRHDLPGIAVAAVDGGTGKRLWECELAVPLSVPPIIDAADRVQGLGATGAVYEVPTAGFSGRRMQDQPSAKVAVKRALPLAAPAARLSDGRLCVAAAPPNDYPQEILYYDPRAEGEKLRWQSLPDALANWPMAFQGGLLVPGKIGQIAVIDPATGRGLMESFQPRVESGRPVPWSEPAPLGDRQVLISDGATKLFRLTVAAQPRPHLIAEAEVSLGDPLLSPLAILGEFAYAADEGNRLLSFHLPDLAPAKDWPLGSKAVWGPYKVGNQVLVGTLNEQLHCFEADQRLAWQGALPHGTVVGLPLAVRGGLLVASSTGGLYRIAADTGKPLATMELAQPLAYGPLVWHDRLLLVGRDGVLHLLAKPE